MLRLRVKEVAQEKKLSMNLLVHRSEVAYNTIEAIYRDPLREATATAINKIARVLGCQQRICWKIMSQRSINS